MCMSPVGESANLSMVITPIYGRINDDIIDFFTEVYHNIRHSIKETIDTVYY